MRHRNSKLEIGSSNPVTPPSPSAPQVRILRPRRALGIAFLVSSLQILISSGAFGQISGAGQLGCNAAPATGTAWSSATAVNSTQTLATNVAGASITVVIDQTSTITAGAISFQEDYGDGNLVTVNAWQVVDPTSSTFAQIGLPYALQASTNKVFLVQMGNAYKLGLKLTTAITGSGTVTPYTNLICYTTPAQVNVANTVPVSGTFWQSTQPVSLSSLPSLASGSNVIGAVTQASGPWTMNLTQVDGTALGAPSAYGTSPGAVNVPGVNAYITNTVPVTGSFSLTLPYSGTSNGQTATSASFLGAGGLYNSSLPSLTNTQFSPFQVDSSGRLIVSCGSGCGGSGGTSLADEGTFTQGTTSFTPVGGFYNTSVTNLSSGEGGAAQLTNTRHLMVNVADALPTGSNTIGTVDIAASQTIGLSAGSNTVGAVTQASGPWTVNLTQVDGTALGAPSNYGTSPGAVSVPGVNAYVTNTVPVSGTFWQTTQPVSLSSLPALASGSNTIGTVDIAASQTIGLASGSNTIGAVTGTLSNNGAAATSNMIASLGGIAQTTPANGSAYTQGRNVAQNCDTGGNCWVSIQPSLRPASYSASSNFAASSTTDNACIYGNATDTVELLEVDVSGIQTTAGSINVALNRHSAAESGGTSANMTVIKGDTTNYGSADSTPVSYTGTGPTTTNIGSIDQKYLNVNASSAAVAADLYVWDGRSEPQLLIGTSQGVCVNIGGALTGGTLSVAFRWKEISNISE